jgi:hypothetical protein
VSKISSTKKSQGLKSGASSLWGKAVIQRVLVKNSDGTFYDPKTRLKVRDIGGGRYVDIFEEEDIVYVYLDDRLVDEKKAGFYIQQSNNPGWTLPGVSITTQTTPQQGDTWLSPYGQTFLSWTPKGTGPFLRVKVSQNTKKKTNRDIGGYDNPDHGHRNMLPLWEKALEKPIPKHTDVSTERKLRDYLMYPKRRFRVKYTPKRKSEMIITGHGEGVLGHDKSAGTHFNETGHKQPREENREYNRQTSTFHGIEWKTSSSQSGSREDRYWSPRPDRNSYRGYYDIKHKDYKRGTWRPFKLMTENDVITYLEDKIKNIRDPQKRKKAMGDLNKLKQKYDKYLAGDLLEVVGEKKRKRDDDWESNKKRRRNQN